MSNAEELIEPPYRGPEGYPDPVDILTGLRDSNAELKRVVAIAATDPSKKVMNEMYLTIDNAKNLINQLYVTDFFKSYKNDMLVTMAVAALVDSIKETFACMQTLVPEYMPRVMIGVAPTDDESFEVPVLNLQTGGDAVSRDARNAKTIEEIADLILTREPQDADLVSGLFAKAGCDAYDNLVGVLKENPVTMAFLQKENRRKELKTNAKRIGMIAVPAFAASAAGTASAELLIKYL